MAEINIYFNNKDYLNLMNYIIQREGRLIPDLLYESNNYCLFDDFKNASGFKKNQTMLYILHDSFSHVALEMKKLDDGEYYIIPKNGGPTIQLLYSKEIEKEGKKYLVNSFIGHYPTYFNANINKLEKVPQSLKNFFAEIRKFVNKNAIKKKVNIGDFYIGKNAISDLKKGSRLKNVSEEELGELVKSF